MNGLDWNFPDRDLFVRLFGGDVYAVGGFVRDRLRGAPRTDRQTDLIDLLIVKHPIERLIQTLTRHGRVDVVGRSFGVIKFTYRDRTYDIALPRTDQPKEVKVRGHKDFIIAADPDLPVETDLSRRDFRCNSIALRLQNEVLIDPFEGQKDIGDRILRLTNPEAFPEDPLRVLRAARFASALEFQVDPGIYEAAKFIDLSGLSVERITEELFRLLLESGSPSVGLDELFKLDALRQIFPELYRMSLTIQDSVFHPEKDEFGHHTAWHHTKITVDQAKRLADRFLPEESQRLILLLAALFHDLGKAGTARWEFKKGRMAITNNGHDIASERLTRTILERYRIHSWKGADLRKMVPALVRCHHRTSDLWINRDVITKKALNRLAADIHGEIELLVYLDAADRAGRDPQPVEDLDEAGRWLLEKFEELNVSKATIQPLFLGRDLIPLGVSEGPGMGRILRKLYEMQLDNIFETKEEGLEQAKKLAARAAKEPS